MTNEDKLKQVADMIRAVADGIENGRFQIVEADFSLPLSSSDGWHYRKMFVEVREFWGAVPVPSFEDYLDAAVSPD